MLPSSHLETFIQDLLLTCRLLISYLSTLKLSYLGHHSSNLSQPPFNWFFSVVLACLDCSLSCTRTVFASDIGNVCVSCVSFVLTSWLSHLVLSWCAWTHLSNHIPGILTTFRENVLPWRHHIL